MTVLIILFFIYAVVKSFIDQNDKDAPRFIWVSLLLLALDMVSKAFLVTLAKRLVARMKRRGKGIDEASLNRARGLGIFICFFLFMGLGISIYSIFKEQTPGVLYVIILFPAVMMYRFAKIKVVVSKDVIYINPHDEFNL